MENLKREAKKIVYLPLDERPCNKDFPQFLFDNADSQKIRLTTPDACILGDKKKPADFARVADYLNEACKDADALVVSADMLVYGGIVPSRLHSLTPEEMQKRLSVLDGLRQRYPKLLIYAFSLIMRCPQYSSSDEEPDYYDVCGREIFLLGTAQHKIELGIASPEEIASVERLKKTTAPHLEDYLSRRRLNTELNLSVIDRVQSGVIDFLIIPQDDSSLYGYIARDQARVREHVKQKNLGNRVLIYPGADEVGLTLLTRALNHFEGATPTVSVNYSSTFGASVVPLYEDRAVGESIKYQIIASGAIPVEDSLTSDIALMVNTPSDKMLSANMTDTAAREYTIERCLSEFAAKIKYLTGRGRAVALADIAYINGGDPELISMLNDYGVEMRLAAYSGWNTSSNTLGTAIAQATLYHYCGNTPAHAAFLALRYFEDVGYCSYARKYVCDHELAPLGLNYFDAGECCGTVAKIVQTRITQYMQTLLPSVAEGFEISRCVMPWKRMFEVGLTVKKRP